MNTDLIFQILVGGLLGVLGQGIRVVSGLAKLNASNAINTASNQPTSAFNAQRLLVSLFIGFIAGAIASLIKGGASSADDKTFIVTIMAAGYSGADFIEGIFQKYLPK
jgi:hypothetical protein